MARVLIASTGSLGDLHPFLALGRGLRARGHAVTVATTPVFADRVAAAGLDFAPLRPDFAEALAADPTLLARSMHPVRGPVVVWREIAVAHIREAYADLLAAARGADLVLYSPIVPAAPMAAEGLGIPCAPAVLQPLSFFSAHDRAVPPNLPWLAGLLRLRRRMGPGVRRVGLWVLRRWLTPVAALRRELGLAPARDPLFNAARPLPFGLALFSPLLAAPQPDWPPRTRPTGFPFWDEADPAAPAGLEAFLDAGPPPIVFTLGSAAVHIAGPSFWRESLEAARCLGRRALLLTGPDRAGLPDPLPGWAFAADYAPHAAVFPRAAAAVHQGGIGTAGQAMRAGRPMLVVPFAHDQPDNADRLRRLGVAAVLPRRRYTAARAAAALSRLLDDAGVIARARAVGEAVRAEDGVGTACGVIEAQLRARPPFPIAPSSTDDGANTAPGRGRPWPSSG